MKLHLGCKPADDEHHQHGIEDKNSNSSRTYLSRFPAANTVVRRDWVRRL
jgi:hypothetical protein